MFEAKVKADVLKEVVDVISTLVDEAKFNVTKDGVSVKAVDPAHVAMVDLSLDRGAFEAYRADECELGIDMDKVKEVLRLAKAGDTITMTHEEDKNRLVLNVGNTTRPMSLLRASESVTDHIALIVGPEGFEIVSEGDTDTVSHKVPKDLLEDLQAKEVVRSLFPLDYFSNMVKAISTAGSVKLHLGSDYPVKMEFPVAGGKGEVRYLLAPRIESD